MGFDIPPPNGESLKMTLQRTLPYFNSEIKPHLLDGKNIILSAHGNSIRSIIMELFNYTSDQILKTEVGWCEPIIYTFNSSFGIIDFELISRTTEPSKSYFPEVKLSD